MQKPRERLPVLRALVEEPRVRRFIKRLFPESVKFFVHSWTEATVLPSLSSSLLASFASSHGDADPVGSLHTYRLTAVLFNAPSTSDSTSRTSTTPRRSP